MSSSSQSMADTGTRLSLATTTGFMVAVAIVVFILFIFIFALYLHANRCYGANPVSEQRRRRRRAIVAEHQHCELDAAAIEAALPSAVYRRPEGSEEGVDCAVCLCELAEGEAARLLPRCKHAFHVECIDMWLYSHSTCPLCRSPVLAAPEKEEAADSRVESSSVLHASDSSSHQEGRSSSSSVSSSWRRQGEVVIEIPRRAAEGLPEEEVMSSPGAAALRSLRRILSCGPREGDMEQGRLPASKMPTTS